MERDTISPIEKLLAIGLEPPFGAVAFDPNRRGSDAIALGAIVETPSNGERAADGQLVLALFCALETPIDGQPNVRRKLTQYGNAINLTEAPEEALTDLLTDLMHYCHREGIEWFGEDGVSQVALRYFSAESGGAVL